MNKIFKGIIFAGALLMAASCQNFLNRPTVDNYNTSNFYQTDEQVEQGVNYLYNSPWYDFQRGFIKVGEVMSGNMYWGNSPYLSLTANGTDVDLMNMSYSLWSVNAHANTIIKNVLASNGASQKMKNRVIGECLTLKALAYFFLVRSFGEVPIVHDNAELLGTGEYNSVKKADRASVYEYIIMTLEKAMDMLEEFKDPQIGKYNRIDYYAAEALLAKVYLTKAGLGGSLNSADLTEAANKAFDVIEHSGRTLTPKYSDIFRLSPAVFNSTGEPLISWQWGISGGQWTRQNTLQSDLIFEGFGDQGDLWGGWGGPSVDLADAFGVKATDDPAVRTSEQDSRRKSTLMMAGDQYDYFWTDKVSPKGYKGFSYIEALYSSDKDYQVGGGEMQCGTGAQNVKHLYGDDADHIAGVGVPPARMAYQLPTHILRLADVYLIYAEAVVGTNNGEALKYVNMVRHRAGAPELTGTITLKDIWKERRLELAGEGDYWYDFVRRSYFDADAAIAELKAQRRSTYNGDMNKVMKKYAETGVWDIVFLTQSTPDGSDVAGWQEGVEGQVWYGTNAVIGKDDAPNVTISSFTLPFPTEDVVFNGNMASNVPGEPVDVREKYKYNF